MKATARRAVLLGAALTLMAFTAGTLHAGAVHAQTPPTCVIDPMSGQFRCLDASGNAINIQTASTTRATPAQSSAATLPQGTPVTFVQSLAVQPLVPLASASVGVTVQAATPTVNSMPFMIGQGQLVPFVASQAGIVVPAMALPVTAIFPGA